MLPILLLTFAPSGIDLINLRVLTHSTTIRAKTYNLHPREAEQSVDGVRIPVFKPCLEIQGNDIVIDFKGSVLRGSSEATAPDKRRGLAIWVRGKNIVIKNLTVRGFKVGLIANNCVNFTLENCDFSYNYKQHLASNLAHEDEGDWQSYHHNEHNEWLRYGAGIYMDHCSRFLVKNVQVVGGQCGLMLNQSNQGLIEGCNFSFLSGIGLGLYRSSENRIQNNRMDWCVRGFSYGVYNRGQDSAGILVFEQSSKNLFAKNSATHGGDGFFLWAGQSTMDTGIGGCNDNLVADNDFSHAVANGIEATFSRNRFYSNKLFECWHGIWGGYSHDSDIIKNRFAYNANSIAIEHGHDNLVSGNTFDFERSGISLWQNAIQDPNWGYPKVNDTASHGYVIQNNLFRHTQSEALTLDRTEDVQVYKNEFHSGPVVSPRLKLEQLEAAKVRFKSNILVTNGSAAPASVSDLIHQKVTREESGNETITAAGLPILNRRFGAPEREAYLRRFDDSDSTSRPKAFLTPKSIRGQRYILVDEWGPYDFQSPLIWPREKLGHKTQRFEILGPPGKWWLNSAKNAMLSVDHGDVPGFVDLASPTGKIGPVQIKLTYRGGKTVDYRGISTAAGKPISFSFEQFVAPIHWDLRFFEWREAMDPLDPHSPPKEFGNLESQHPLMEIQSDTLDFAGAALVSGLPLDHYRTVGNGEVTLPGGNYEISLTTDDGARLFLDGQLLVEDAWHYQGPTTYKRKVKLSGGLHRLKVEHFQIDGYAMLKVELRPTTNR